MEQSYRRGDLGYMLHSEAVDLHSYGITIVGLPSGYSYKASGYQSRKTGSLEGRGSRGSYIARGDLETSQVGSYEEPPSTRTSQDA